MMMSWMWALALASSVRAQSVGEISGRLEVIVEMPMMAGSMGPESVGVREHVMGDPIYHFRLKTDAGRYVMLQGGGLDASTMRTGARLRVTGQAAATATALAVSAPAALARSPVDYPAFSASAVVVESPPPATVGHMTVASVGAATAPAVVTRTVHVIYAVPDGQPTYPPQDDPGSSLTEFYKRVSYGRLNFAVRNYWVHDSAADLYTCTFGLDSSDAPPDAENADYIVYVKGCSGVCYGVLGGNASVCMSVSNHEVGHNLGFQHANLYFCHATTDPMTGVNKMVSLADVRKDPTLCTSHTYGDGFDVMGQGDGLNITHRSLWLSASELPTVSAGGTFTVGSIDDAAAPVKGLRIVPGPFSVEYHPGSGVMIHWEVVAGSNYHGQGDTQVIYAVRPNNPYNPLDPMWHKGDRFDDPMHDIHITVLDESAISAQVQVQFGSAAAARSTPGVTILAPAPNSTPTGSVRVLAAVDDSVTKVELYDGSTLLQTQSSGAAQ